MSYRNLSKVVSLSNINSQVETLLRVNGFIKNSENVAELKIDFNNITKDAVTGESVVWVSVKTYKDQEVRVIKHG